MNEETFGKEYIYDKGTPIAILGGITDKLLADYLIWKEHFKVVAFIFNVDIDLHEIYGVPIKKTTEISNLFGTYPDLKIIIDVKDYDYIGFSRFLIERKKLTFIDHWYISQLFMYDKIDVPIL